MPIEIYEFFAIDGAPNFWSILNSPFVTAVGIAAIGIWFERRLNKQSQNRLVADTELRGKKAEETVRAEFAAQIPQESSTVHSLQDYRDQAVEGVSNLKNRINELARDDPDRRHHRVYNRLKRHNYKALVQALYERDQFGKTTYSKVMLALAVWDDYARGRASVKKVPKAVVDLISTAQQSVSS